MALNNKYDDAFINYLRMTETAEDTIKFSLKITEREKEDKKIAHEKKNRKYQLLALQSK